MKNRKEENGKCLFFSPNFLCTLLKLLNTKRRITVKIKDFIVSKLKAAKWWLLKRLTVRKD